MYPSGVEYIVLAQKQVIKISGTTIWMDMSEADTLLLNSAIVDSYLTDGTKLYAVRYSDPTTQIKLGETDQVINQAKLYLKDELGKELSSIETIDEVYNVEEKETGNIDIYGEPETTPVKTVREEIIDVLTRYAIEYRYYIESYNKTVANYQPNSQVMSFMKQNQYIVKQAKDKLNAQARQNIESSIAVFENSNADSYANVVAGINTSVSAQQSLRTDALGQ